MADGIEDFLNGLARYASFLPDGDEQPLEILILRGHLLIEEELRRLVALKFVKPASYDLREKKFGALLSLAEALYGPTLPEWVWGVARTLNSVRNSLAHELESKDVTVGVGRILKAFEAKHPSFASGDAEVLRRLNYCLSSLHVEFARARTN